VLGTASETQNGASKTTSEIDDKNQIKNRFISSQTFNRTPDERVQKITTKVQFKPQNLESFNPMTQYYYRNEFQEQRSPNRRTEATITAGENGHVEQMQRQ
jgi:hypothetical protein